MKYEDIALKLAQLDAQFKGCLTRGAGAMKKLNSAIKDRDDAQNAVVLAKEARDALIAESVAIKEQRKELLAEFKARADQL